MASSDTMAWLRTQKFDFNHWVDHAVPYWRSGSSKAAEEDLSELRSKLAALRKQADGQQGDEADAGKDRGQKIPLTKPVDKEYVENLLALSLIHI